MDTNETNQQSPKVQSWPHGEVVEAVEADGFSPPGSQGFVLRPLATSEDGTPAMLLGTLEPGGSIPREIHESAREHLLVIEGEVRYRADDGTSVRIGPGQMGRLNRNTWHLVENAANVECRFVVCLA